ncbi:MAG: zinc ribbon domain-containing protein [Microbacteriaceae bacterium]
MNNLAVPAAEQAKLLDVLEADTEIVVQSRRIREAQSALIALETDSDYVRLVRDAEAAEDRVDDAQKACDHLESDIAAARTRIIRDREREEHTNDPKELSDLESEIQSLELRIETLEGDELDALEARDAAIAARDKIVSERDTFHERRDAQQAGLEADIARANDRIGALNRLRAEILGQVPTELADLYERQRERYGVGASFLQRGITSASGVQLSPSQLDEIRLADPNSVIICPDSNAILIRTADSGL